MIRASIRSKEIMPTKLGPPPKASSSHVSKSMKSNKAKGTRPEKTLVRSLRALKVASFKINWNKIPGTPDICFPENKLAIFVNGCFWHRCPYCKLSLPRSNRSFWKKKFLRNKTRDRLKKTRLSRMGWKTLTIWECQIKKHLDKTMTKIFKALGS